ncbi:MAG TPA: hypothetical protein VGG63_07405 [Steroidobacteraceae bacterium]
MASFTVVYDACLLYPASIPDFVAELGRANEIEVALASPYRPY